LRISDQSTLEAKRRPLPCKSNLAHPPPKSDFFFLTTTTAIRYGYSVYFLLQNIPSKVLEVEKYGYNPNVVQALEQGWN
jgi:hypothetical protein